MEKLYTPYHSPNIKKTCSEEMHLEVILLALISASSIKGVTISDLQMVQMTNVGGSSSSAAADTSSQATSTAALVDADAVSASSVYNDYSSSSEATTTPDANYADATTTVSVGTVVVQENVYINNGVATTEYSTYTTYGDAVTSSTLPTTTLQPAATTSSADYPTYSAAEPSTTADASYTTSETPSSTTSSDATASATQSLGDFEQSMLNQHNAKRALHQNTGSLSWSSDLESVAQAYADSYDCSGTLVHSGKPYGENLALGYSLYDGSTAIDAWYDEISLYDFSNPGFGEDTGHFTQVVWKDTTQVGCGYKNCNNAWGDYLVCNYLAQGNVIGEFASEVEPLIN